MYENLSNVLGLIHHDMCLLNLFMIDKYPNYNEHSQNVILTDLSPSTHVQETSTATSENAVMGDAINTVSVEASTSIEVPLARGMIAVFDYAVLTKKCAGEMLLLEAIVSHWEKLMEQTVSTFL